MKFPTLVRVFLSTTLLFLSCKSRPVESTAPPIDQSTPDRLVESLWAYKSWEDAHEAKHYASKPHPEFSAYTSEVQAQFQKNMNSAIEDSSFRKNNRVLKVNVESPTRAVVVASEKPGSWSKESEETTYLLAIGSDNKWVIRDKTMVCWHCRGTGKAEDLDQRKSDIQANRLNTHPMKICDVCQGKGWNSQYFKG